MLARIQSLYLLLVVIFTGLNLQILPFWLFDLKSAENVEMAKHLVLVGITEFGTSSDVVVMVWGFNVFLLTAMMLAAIGIFLFSNRKIQVKLVSSSGIATLVTIALGVAASITFIDKMGQYEASGLPGIGFYLLLLCLVLQWLAVGAINKDDQVANAYKRL
ncbi:hypothetical protein Ctha_0569 [Chloroherpeton thalassium ATCC 35110]|uniref:DUF4293 family protein n=1 Tax=Chloroherpeton thalassium (strain ATCC 35110 / GB-78) TaxID=517418 RepID=B3QV86_CHLT3|nr:DUF4293 domain-containing protein [Chloroherpeton thalassium]ACF13040.1 hypothetical protein Ctha_0569 [Chloroherpeton thalassium ATCC 35110]